MGCCKSVEREKMRDYVACSTMKKNILFVQDHNHRKIELSESDTDNETSQNNSVDEIKVVIKGGEEEKQEIEIITTDDEFELVYP